MTALFDALDAHERAQDAAAAARAEYEPVMAELARLVDVLVHHGVDLERVQIDGGAGIVREAIRFIDEMVQARDYFFEQWRRVEYAKAALSPDATPEAIYWHTEARRLTEVNTGLLARIHSLKARLGQVQ